MTKKLSVTDGQTDRPMDRAGHSHLHAAKNAKFLVTCTRLYTPICLSVGWSVCWSVGHTFTFFINFISLSHLKSFKSILSHSKSICKSRTRLIGVGLVFKEMAYCVQKKETQTRKCAHVDVSLHKI